ncbi:MAG: GNAT family protein [Thermodesulfobacteriota bacterium]
MTIENKQPKKEVGHVVEDSSGLVFIEGRRIIMRPLLEEDFHLEYLSWLNDPEVNEFSQRRPFPVNREGMRKYAEFYQQNPQRGFVLALIVKETRVHIGNISLVNLEPVHRCAEIAILIGDKNHWNQGYAAEAIYLLTEHAFRRMNLHRVFAGTFNPAFGRCVAKLGWIKEGEFRERIWSEGRYHHQLWYGLLKSEFQARPEYAPLDGTLADEPEEETKT